MRDGNASRTAAIVDETKSKDCPMNQVIVRVLGREWVSVVHPSGLTDQVGLRRKGIGEKRDKSAMTLDPDCMDCVAVNPAMKESVIESVALTPQQERRGAAHE